MNIQCSEEADELEIPLSRLQSVLEVVIAYLSDKGDDTKLSDRYWHILDKINAKQKLDVRRFNKTDFDSIKRALFINSKERKNYAPVTEDNLKQIRKYSVQIFSDMFKSKPGKPLKPIVAIRKKINSIDHLADCDDETLQRIRNWFNAVYIYSVSPELLEHITVYDLAYGYAKVLNDLSGKSNLVTVSKKDFSKLVSDMAFYAIKNDKPHINKDFLKVMNIKKVDGLQAETFHGLQNVFVNIFLNNYMDNGIPYQDMIIELKSDQRNYLDVIPTKMTKSDQLGVDIDEMPEVITKKAVGSYIHAMFVSLLYDRDRDVAKRIYQKISKPDFLDRAEVDISTLNNMHVFTSDLYMMLRTDNVDFTALLDDADHISAVLGVDVIKDYPINADRRMIIQATRDMLSYVLHADKNKTERLAYKISLLTHVDGIDAPTLADMKDGFDELRYAYNKNKLRFRNNICQAVEDIDLNLDLKKPAFNDIYKKYKLNMKEKFKLMWNPKN